MKQLDEITNIKSLIANYSKKIIMRAELDENKFGIEDAKDMQCFANIIANWCKSLVDNM